MFIVTSILVCFIQYTLARHRFKTYHDEPKVVTNELTFATEPQEASILGKTIYTPETDLLGSVPNPISFFEEIPEHCMSHAEEPVTTKHQTEYDSTKSFYQKIGTDTSLDAKYQSDFTLHVTLDVTTSHVSSSKRTVKGVSLDMVAKSHIKQLSINCLYETPLNKYLLMDFNELPLKITEPWNANSWSIYHSFFARHGSHFITAVHYGSSISQYAFADSSSSYTSNDLRIKACASLSAEASSNSIDACTSVTTEEIESVSSKKITSTITLRGGTHETRSLLTLKPSRTDENIQKFLNEGTTNPGMIAYELRPIWEVLGGHYSAGDNRRILAANLRYYYEGFLNFGCDYVEGSRGPALQMFNYASESTAGSPVFECTLAPLGCHSADDCHYKVGVTCACHGDSCIKYYSTTSNTGVSRKMAEANYDSDYGWVNCGWTTWGSRCGCTHESSHRQRVFP